MARTGRRAGVLQRLLRTAGLGAATRLAPRPTGSVHYAELLALYRALGGLVDLPSWRPGGWDLQFADVLVELDEQLHFNRYRATTLDMSWAADLPWTDPYRDYCASHEARCLLDGRGQQRWTNASCARNFTGGHAGDLEAGAPRWKQRAFYDAMKDTLPASGLDFAFARASIYDTVDGVLPDDVLEERAYASPAAVRSLVELRTAHPH